jgi:hypothetical protein
MPDDVSEYDARQAAKFSGVPDSAYIEEVADWCKTATHARFMLQVQLRKVTKRLEDLKEMQEMLALNMAAMHAVTVKMREQGWSE